MDDIVDFQDRYRAVFELSDDSTFIIKSLPSRADGRRDYRFVAVNLAMKSMFSLADVTGKSLLDSLPEMAASCCDDFDRVLETGSAAHTEWKPTSDEMVFGMSISRLGSSRELLVVVKRRTPEDHSPENLRRSREKYKLLFESIDEGFCIIEVMLDEAGLACDYRFLEANPAFQRQTGLVDAVGRTMRELAPDHEDHWFQIYGRIAKTGQPERFEDKAAALGRWYDVYAFRIGPPHERMVAILFRDVLPRKRMEQALRRSEERARALVTASSDVVYRMSPDWQEMRQIDGHGLETTPEEKPTRWIDEYILPEDRAEVGAAIDKAVTLRNVFEREHRVRRPDGSIGWALSRAVPICDEAGEIYEWFGMATDITDRRRSEEQRMLLNEELAHRLKNVFAVVSSVVSQTLRTAPDMQSAQSTLSERIRNMARAQDILFSGHSRTASVRDLVEATLSAQSEASRIGLSGPDIVIGRNAALALALVLHELLTNAIKYGSLSVPNGRVELNWSLDAGRGGDNTFQIGWHELDGPLVTAPSKTSFGTRLIRAGLVSGGRGNVQVEYRPEGVFCQLSAPLSALQEDDGK